MSAPLSRQSASGFALLLLISTYPALLGFSMGPFLVVTSVCAIVLLLFGPGWYRVVGGAGLALSMLLIVSEYQNRQDRVERLRRMMQWNSLREPVQGANQSSQATAATLGSRAVQVIWPHPFQSVSALSAAAPSSCAQSQPRPGERFGEDPKGTARPGWPLRWARQEET